MILTVGATGNLGGSITARLLERGHSVRALVREESTHDELQAAGAEVVVGDLTAPASLIDACQGIEQIVASATAATRGEAEMIEAVDRHGYAGLIEAAEAQEVEQFVFVSAQGFALDSPGALARAKANTEALLAHGKMGFTVLKPALFMEAWISMIVGAQLQAGPRLTVIGDPDRRYGFIATENVADLALSTLANPQALRQTIPLSAASASYREIAEWVGEVTGQAIEVVSVPQNLFIVVQRIGIRQIIAHDLMVRCLEVERVFRPLFQFVASCCHGCKLSPAADCCPVLRTMRHESNRTLLFTLVAADVDA